MTLPELKTLLNDLLIAFSLLTRLPVPNAGWSDETRPPAHAAWAYPLVGIVVGGIAAILAGFALALGIPAPIAALIFMIGGVIATGAMHEDGLADCADGFWGGWDKTRRLEIMKDSAIGTYGVLALVFVFALRWMIYSELLSNGLPLWALVLPAVISRAAMVGVMQALPNARGDGLSSDTGRPGSTPTYAALGIGLVAALLLPEIGFFWVVLATAMGAGLVSLTAKAKIGGQTGDVLGTTQQITEAFILIAISALYVSVHLQ